MEVSRFDGLSRIYREWVRIPALVLWDDRRTRIGSVILGAYVLLGTVGVWLYPAPRIPDGGGPGRFLRPFQDVAAPLGTNGRGTDVLAQAIHETPTVLLLLGSGVVLAIGIATFVATIEVMCTSRLKNPIRWFTSALWYLPGIPIVLFLLYVWAIDNPIALGAIIGIVCYPGIARRLRTELALLSSENVVEASRVNGVGSTRLFFTDIVPHIADVVAVQSIYVARYVLIVAVAFAYLGVFPADSIWTLAPEFLYGVPPPFAFGEFDLTQHVFVVPGVFVVGLSLGLTLFAQGVHRVFDPRVRARVSDPTEGRPDEPKDQRWHNDQIPS